MPAVAEVLINGLSGAGVDNIFGIPGGETVEMIDAVRRSEIDFTLVHRESSAAFMASATARLTGRPSACLTTLGPGATNVLTGVAHAHLDRTPVIAITAKTPERLLPGHTHQVLDLENLFSSITKGSFQVEAAGASEMIRNAIALASAGRPGPVHLQISNDVAVQETEAPGAERAQPEAAPTGDLAKAIEVLRKSRRPVLIAGLGLEPERPYTELRRLSEAIHAPVIVTPKAKGAIPDDHSLYAGTVGLTQTDPVYELLDRADCIVAVGFDVVELVKPWDHPAPLICVAPWRNADPKLPAAAELVGPMAPVLDHLAETIVDVVDGWGEPLVADQRRKFPTLQAVDSDKLLAPQTVLRVLRDHLPHEAVITTDVGSHKILTCLQWPAYDPNRFLVSNGLSSMGYSLPAAIAAGIALPGTQVICTTGDAGLLMSMSELSTLERLDIPVTVVIFKDHALDLIRSHQIRSGKPPFATEFTAPDFVQIAEAHGIPARRVSDEDTLVGALKRFVSSSKPALIEALIDPTTYPTTPTEH